MKRYQVMYLEKVYHRATIEAENDHEAYEIAEEALTDGAVEFYQESECFEFLESCELEENEFTYYPMFSKDGYIGKDIEPQYKKTAKGESENE